MIDLPEEKDGAFVFRSGLEDALIINGVNSNNVKIVNLLERDEMLKLPEVIKPEKINNEIIIPPVVNIKTNKTDLGVTIQAGDSTYISNDKESVILYWNKKRMMKIATIILFKRSDVQYGNGRRYYERAYIFKQSNVFREVSGFQH